VVLRVLYAEDAVDDLPLRHCKQIGHCLESLATRCCSSQGTAPGQCLT
jgi:hypothetical protein